MCNVHLESLLYTSTTPDLRRPGSGRSACLLDYTLRMYIVDVFAFIVLTLWLFFPEVTHWQLAAGTSESDSPFQYR